MSARDVLEQARAIALEKKKQMEKGTGNAATEKQEKPVIEKEKCEFCGEEISKKAMKKHLSRCEKNPESVKSKDIDDILGKIVQQIEALEKENKELKEKITSISNNQSGKTIPSSDTIYEMLMSFCKDSNVQIFKGLHDHSQDKRKHWRMIITRTISALVDMGMIK